MLGLFVVFLSLLPLVLGVAAWRSARQGGGSHSDDPPPPPEPLGPRPVSPAHPRRCHDRGHILPAGIRSPMHFART